MPTPPPVPAASRYPVAIRDFVTYQDQPGDANHIIQGPNGPLDLTIDYSSVTKDLQTEIISIEEIVGPNPPMYAGNRTLGTMIKWIYLNKAWGQVDSGGVIHPAPHNSHSHYHLNMLGDHWEVYNAPEGATEAGPSQPGAPAPTPIAKFLVIADDHPQYMREDATRPFTAPVNAPAATSGSQLINYSQARGAGLTASQVENMIQNAINSELTEPYPPYTAFPPITGPTRDRYTMTGGEASGYTDENGFFYVDFSSARFSEVLSFVYMKMPYGLLSYFYGWVYQYEEDQLVLASLTNQGALIQFREDIVVDRQAWIRLSWIAFGL